MHATAISTIKPTVDSLLQRGYRLYQYRPGFTPITQEQWLALSSNPQDSVVASSNHWSLLPALAQRYKAPQDSVWLFTSDQHRHFAGPRPASMPENINWLPVRLLESAAIWLQTATSISSDSLQLLLGHSQPDGTRYSRHRIAIPGASQAVALQSGQRVQLMRAGDSLWAKLAERPGRRVPVRTQALQLAVYTDEEQLTEMKYLQAVTRAVSLYTGIPISMRRITAPDTVADMTFWLSSDAVPEGILQQVREQGKRLWLQSGSPAAAVIPASFRASGTNIKMNRNSLRSSANEVPVWETENGDLLLTEELVGKGSVYRFRGGFGPAWGELGQSPLLPELLLPLLLPATSAPDFDRRVLEEQQIRLPKQPVTAVAQPAAQQYPLAQWFITAAFVLFLIERLIVTRKRTSV